jgi:hypothetical protein
MLSPDGGTPLTSDSSTGPRRRVSGVRNSWLMLLKKVVFARSSSASSSSRRRSASKARASATALATCPAASERKPR